MSTSTILGAAGAAIGGFFGGPTGAQIGWMIGSGVGSYVDPDVIKQQGPRLSQATQQTARDGVPITIGYGTFATTGDIIWRAPLVENVIVTRERQGKGGGPVTENTTYQYTRSYAIGICEGPIAGLLIVKKNGKIVYDARTDDELAAVGYDAAAIQSTRAASAGFMANVAVYLGDETQVADSVIEAHKGVGNAPPYRGTAYIRFENDDLTELQGAIPQFEFVVVMDGEATPGTVSPQWAATNSEELGFSGDGTTWNTTPDDVSVSAPAQRLSFGGGVLLKWDGSTIRRSTDRGVTWLVPTGPIDPAAGSTGSVKYFADQWWAVSANNPAKDVGTSPDGDSWSYTTISMPGSPTCVGGHHGLVVVGDNFGRVIYSTDSGATWSGATNILGGATTDFYDIASDGTIVVIVGQNNQIHATTNGETWTARTSPFAPGTQIERIRYSAGLDKWVMLAPGVGLAWSDDSVAWTLATTTFPDGVTSLDANDELFVVVGGDATDARIYTSSDGDVWTTRTNLFGGGMTDVAAMPCDGTPIPDAPGWYVHDDGTLCGGDGGGQLGRERVVVGPIVADVCQRDGLTSDQYDVSDLTDTLDGSRFASETGGDSIIAPLLAYSFADSGEWDGQIHFVKRGGDVVIELTADDLAARDGDAIEIERVQEAELLRKQTVSYLDPLATYTVTTQQWERRSGTVQAKGEGSAEFPLVTSGTDMIQTAEKMVKGAWAETERYKFSLPYRFSRITPTDVVQLTDKNGVVHRIRVTVVEEDSGVLLIEGIKDKQATYTAVTSATPPTFPGPTPPAVRGPTILRAFNGPPLSTSQDTPGFHVAVTGLLPGWLGCDLYMSLDGGETETFVGRLLNRATIGWLTSAITSSSSTISVQLYDGKEIDTISDAQMDANQNVWAIVTGSNAEIGQSQTSTPNGDAFDLTDNERGLLGTTETSHASNDDFVLLNEAVYYIELSNTYAGRTVRLRAVSIGTAAAENAVTTFVYDPAVIVWDGNGEDPDDDDGPTPPSGGAGAPGTPTARTIGATVVTPSLTAGEANAAANSSAINTASSGGNKIVRLPAGTYYIDTSDPIIVRDNMRLDLGTNGTILRAAGTNTVTAPSNHRDIVKVNGANQWEIMGGSGAELIGYRDYWAANGGVAQFGVSEWGHGIYVTNSSTNGTIYDLTMSKFIGDGISVGRSSSNLHILNCLSTNNRRQGYSVAGISSGANIHLENCEGSYIGLGDGTSPKAGCDYEVDEPATHSVSGITLTNCYFHHNAGPGLICYKSCNDLTAVNLRSEYNTKGIYAVDSDNCDISGTIRWNKYEGAHLTGTCSGWNFDGVAFFSNKTKQYGTFTSGATTTSPTTTQKAKHITIGSSVSGTTYGTNTYGPV